MRLLFINYEFPPLGGGGGRASAAIAREMAQMGHEVVVLSSAFKQLPREEARDGYRIVRIPSLRRYQEKCRVYEMIAFMLSALWYAVKLARRFKPDFSIAFFTIPSAPAAYLIKRLYGIPYLVSLRGGDVPGFMGKELWLYHRLTKPLIRLLWQQAKAVVANSSGLKQLARKSSPTLSVAIVPNGVDTRFFQSENPPFPPLPKGGLGGFKSHGVRLLTVGRLGPQKAIDTLLIAFSKLRSQLATPVHLSIVGDGPLRQTLEKLAQTLGIASQVSFLGWHSPQAVRDFYAQADIFVLSSVDEGMPNVILEAMAMGLPIVATTIAGSEELVQHGVNGYLVAPQQPDALARAVGWIIRDDKLRARMAQASRARVGQYEWHDVAERYLKLC